jgi:phosphoenolpyruvate synthase/pyruvate phosphate dikinase
MKQQENVIKGIPASRGRVCGTAKVLTSLDQISKFKKGDILVTIATSPDWTPLIFTASAVVTDMGGSLCHAAIVSREYGIPAVTGTKNATRIIKDGQKIEVDGEKGLIAIIE